MSFLNLIRITFKLKFSGKIDSPKLCLLSANLLNQEISLLLMKLKKMIVLKIDNILHIISTCLSVLYKAFFRHII
jgi:hypothetical protein